MKTKSIIKLVLVNYLAVFLLMTAVWILLPGGSDCTTGQEIEEGCRVVFPDTYILLLIISLPVSVLSSIASYFILKLKKR